MRTEATCIGTGEHWRSGALLKVEEDFGGKTAAWCQSYISGEPAGRLLFRNQQKQAQSFKWHLMDHHSHAKTAGIAAYTQQLVAYIRQDEGIQKAYP
ncbi:hypothetical protein Pelo_18126 [Pelomyxa schiedti]|nr:hypothetical protein Pelo_18126 [Pelomyxa schiedti]